MTTYTYHNADGATIYTVERTPDKRFSMAGNTSDRVPYQLATLLTAARAGGSAFIVEGEKDADNLSAALVDFTDVAVTTSAGGAGWQWPASWWRYFRGLQACYVIADNDDIGRRAAVQRARMLKAIVSKVTVLACLPGVAEHGDVTDWLHNGGDIDQLWRLVEGAPDIRSIPEPARTNQHKRAAIVTMSDVQLEQVQWLWPGWLALGKLALLEGKPSLGKSTLALTLAARVSTGTPFPDESTDTRREPRDVVLLSAEDSAGDTLKPRLLEAGADLSRIHLLQGIISDQDDKRPDMLHLPEDVDVLEDVIRQTNAAFCVMDVLAAYTGMRRNISVNNDADIRTMLSPLTAMLTDTHASGVGLRHWTKSGDDDLVNRGGGSIAISAAARHIYACVQHPENDQLYVLICAKNNLAAKPEPLSYSIVSGDTYNTARLQWQGPIDITVQELMRSRGNQLPGADEHTEQERAQSYVFTALIDGPLFANAVISTGLDAGFSKATVQRAATQLGVHKHRVQQDDGTVRSVWSLPDQ